jgi:hypothetical protein
MFRTVLKGDSDLDYHLEEKFHPDRHHLPHCPYREAPMDV